MQVMQCCPILGCCFFLILFQMIGQEALYNYSDTQFAVSAASIQYYLLT